MREIELPKITDGRGNLTFFESERFVPFKIKGVFLINIYDTSDRYEFIDNKNVEFFLVALSGSFAFENDSADDFMDGLCLENANKGLYIEKNINFTLQFFADNTVVLILSSMEYINFVRKV